jgi:hypothetical protein
MLSTRLYIRLPVSDARWQVRVIGETGSIQTQGRPTRASYVENPPCSCMQRSIVNLATEIGLSYLNRQHVAGMLACIPAPYVRVHVHGYAIWSYRDVPTEAGRTLSDVADGTIIFVDLAAPRTAPGRVQNDAQRWRAKSPDYISWDTLKRRCVSCEDRSAAYRSAGKRNPLFVRSSQV